MPERHGFLASINYKGGILNGILQVYRWTGPVLAALGFASWLLLSVRRIRCLVKKEKDEDSLARWLVVTSLLASYLVLLGGISYSEISGWNAILYWYLSGGYPVMIAFEVLALIFAWYDPVSYTHLDGYNRQNLSRAAYFMPVWSICFYICLFLW